MIRKTVFQHPSTGLLAGLLLSGLLAVSPAASAQEADAGAFIQNLESQAMQVLRPSVPTEHRSAAFRQLLARDFDMTGLTRFVLGPNARGLSPEQQQEFTVLLRDNMAEAYSTKLSQYAGEPFRVTGTRPMGGETVVASQVERRSGQPVEIDWHVVNHDGHFLVTDVAVDGVSQKLTQRNEFAGIVQRNGGRPEALIAALRQQLQQKPATRMEPSYGSSVPAR